MDDTTAPPPDLPLEGLADAVEVYIEGYQGVSVLNGVAKLNMYADYLDTSSGTLKRRCVQRLVMPLPTLLQIHEALGGLVNQMEKDGLIQRVETHHGD